MPFVTTADGTDIFYKDWGGGQPVVFSHGWPLSGDAWDVEMKLAADNGFRAIAHDRRGQGRSSQTWHGHDMDTYAADLAAVVDALGLDDVILVGHSTGGGEVVRFAAQHGGGRVAKIVTVGAVPPIMVKSDSNPDGTPIEVFDGIRAGVMADRSQYFMDLSEQFFGINKGSGVSQGQREQFWRLGMQMSLKAAYDCIAAFSETNFTDDLLALDVPVLICQGDADQIVPIADAALKSIDLVKNGTLKVYPGAPHGIAGAYQVALDRDLLEFWRS
ncbi:alpha/beta fold hydrolase [Paractinoplanes brasiliensis]|uniref:Non-heme chloroperoxidase n=1 Tax=Paractinoplanes brasiliensis TaxID=52695 RepID=A0A4R6JPC0_9ACTN|nr:alpha/beta hydrolase [Actinoplanes brasiliensis]TDO36626.1 non-heme chloroperoxidase [Actinoplanes brasiliensis]GID32407.1 non-heme chloroperoxidase [Actinoplanes brasiliensis]